MSTQAAGSILADRIAQYKQAKAINRDVSVLNGSVTAYIPSPIAGFIIKPAPKSWAELEPILQQVVNLPGFIESRVKELYDQGYAAELETAAEIALATAKKSPYHLFTAMISRKRGNWSTKTLKMVQTVWEVRQHAAYALDKLKLGMSSLKPVLAAAWRLRSSIVRYVGIATEQGTGVTNPAGLFFWLTKQRPAIP
jgi:hypothetical protein